MDREGIGPFRMQLLMEVAAKAVKIMTTGVWHLSFDEMDIVLEYIRYGIDAYRRKHEEEKNNVPENQRVKKDHEECSEKFWTDRG